MQDLGSSSYPTLLTYILFDPASAIRHKPQGFTSQNLEKRNQQISGLKKNM